MNAAHDDLAQLRKSYERAALDEEASEADPFKQFEAWLAQAIDAKLPEPNAMTLATVGPEGRPSTRVVLIKGLDARGIVWYTNYDSRKGRELADNPAASLCFFWGELERQVRVTGAVQRVSRAEADAYFQSRPLPSRMGAWSSHQSQVLPSRDVLEAELATTQARFADGAVPLPEHWGGFRVVPDEVEFWQGRSSRLHDRIQYRLEAGAWVRRRLSP